MESKNTTHGDSISCFICGEHDHECDSKGPIIYWFSDFYVGTLFEKCKIEKINLQMCDADKLYFLAQKDIHVNGALVSCSKCGSDALHKSLMSGI